MSSFYKGTLLLILTAFFGECIEFVANIVLARELGERGLGLYMSILPSVFLIVLLASFEFPIAISKFIAERDQKYHLGMLRHVIHLTIVFTTVLSSLAAIIIPFVPLFHEYHPMFKWLVLAMIPIISFSSIARGYFMGKQQMGKIAVSNFLRKIVQLLMLVSLYQWFDFDMQAAILIAFCTIVGSDLVVFIYLLHMFIIQYSHLKKGNVGNLSKKIIRKDLLAVSIPTTGLRVFYALTHAIQPFLIKAALVYGGISEAMATEQYGMLAGIAMTVGFFPAFIAHSFMTMLIPTVSKAFAEKDIDVLRSRLQQIILITLGYGLPAVGVFYFLAEPLTRYFFHSTGAAYYLQLLWPYFLLHYFTIPMQAYLIGLGLMKDAVFHTVWSTIISLSSMYFLGSMQSLQMEGVIIGLNLGACVLTLLHYVTICKKLGFSMLLSPSNRFR